ncbi:hypothetical protein [Halogranum amylolyticum]|uniref:hypothetical protein n=1 Tax=Halogranum amylolyticum TaxID=660520 RepID=UPI001B8B9881|nr:hypothetical protein [Halogranum amylolyticum]
MGKRSAAAALAAVARFWRMLSAGFTAVLEPTRLYHVFIRGGYIEAVARKDLGHAITLSLLESAPIFAALIALPGALSRRLRGTDVSVLLARRRSLSARHATDLLVAAIAVLFVLFYLPRLPLHVMITVRYLLPVMPLLLYAVFRLQQVHDLLGYPRTLVPSSPSPSASASNCSSLLSSS